MWLDELKRIKEESGKTTDEIAEMSGVPKGTLNKIFAGQTKAPQLETVKAVVYCLGHSLDDLFVGIARKSLSGEAAAIASAYDRADEKNRSIVRLALADFLPSPQVSAAPQEPKNVHDWRAETPPPKTREQEAAEVSAKIYAEMLNGGEKTGESGQPPAGVIIA